MQALYVRTSTDDNDGSAQLHELQAWSERQGWDKPRIYLDRGESGVRASRPEWDRLRADARRGRITDLAATELSRLGRSVVSVVLAMDELNAAGVRVVLLRQGLDYGTPVGRAVAAILAAVAQLEHDQIRERIRAGVRRARERGSRSGRAIGRPRRDLDVSTARQLRAGNASWEEIAKVLRVGAGTVRRALQACQNPMPENEVSTT